MKCARCGVGLDDQSLVCGQCGAVVGVSYGPPASRASFLPRPATPQATTSGGQTPQAMTGSGQTPRLVDRVKSILRSPKRTWPVIASEPMSALDIYMGYAMPLAAIGALALFVSQVMLGEAVPMLGVVRENFVTGLTGAILVFAFALVHLYVLAWIISALARKFGGQGDRLQALKMAAYSYTPIWLAGILYLIPPLSFLWAIAAFYALFLAMIGSPVCTRCGTAQAALVVILTAVAGFVLFTVFGALITALVGFGPALLG